MVIVSLTSLYLVVNVGLRRQQAAQAQAEQEQRLGRAIADLFDNHHKRTELALKLHDFARPQAAETIAKLLLETAKTSGAAA